MINKDAILQSIKKSVHATDPDAVVILYGSYARGDYDEESDIDILVLIDVEKIAREDRIRIGHPLHDIELKEHIVISPMIRPKAVWATEYPITSLYKNISSEGVRL